MRNAPLERRRTSALAGVLIGAVVVLALLVVARSDALPTGGYVDFPGPAVGYLDVAHDPALSPTGEITVEAWIYLRSYANGFGTDTDCPMIVGKNWVVSYALALSCGGNNLVVDGYVNGVLAEGQLVIPTNQWTHIAMTYDGTTLRTYRNGQQDASVALSGDIAMSTDPLRIGKDTQWDRTPDGSIDDVRIWNLARSQTQIEAGMNNLSSTIGLVARWTFDGGSLADVVSGRVATEIGDVDVVVPTPTPSPSPTVPSATVTPTPTPLPTGSPVPAGAKGDIDCNQEIGLADLQLFLIALAGLSEVDASCIAEPAGGPLPMRLDLDCNGIVEDLDALHLLWHFVDISKPLPSNCVEIGEQPGIAPSGTAPGTPSFTPAPTAAP